MIQQLIGQWLPAKAKCLFEDYPSAHVILLEKQDDQWRLNLCNMEHAKDHEFESMYLLPMPNIPQDAVEPSDKVEEIQNEDNPA